MNHLKVFKTCCYALLVPASQAAIAHADEAPSLISTQCQNHSSQHSSLAVPKASTVASVEELSLTPDTAEIVIESDSAEIFEDGRMSLKGNVQIKHPQYSVASERAQVNKLSGEASLEGGVTLSSPFLDLEGDSAQVNLEKNESQITSVRFQHKASNLRGEAKRLKQASATQAELEQGVFTTCDLDNPVWAIRASEIKLDQESGFGEAKHTRLEVLDVPVLYVPWFSFPIDDRRKSGFLYPTVGTSNTGSGIFISTPYYWNIAPELDATYTPSFIGGRGLHHELETRHLSSVVATELGLGFIEEDEDFNDEQRWALSLDQQWDFASYHSNWFGSVDFTRVSDEDYLEDLNQGLQVANQTELDQRARFNYIQENWSVDIQVQRFENLDEDQLVSEEAFQRLPEVNFRAFDNLGAVHLDWQSQYVYFYRNPNDQARADQAFGSRFRHVPKFSLPLRATWGHITPSIEIDHTDYYLRERVQRDNHISRTIPFYEIDSAIYLDRNTQVFGSSYLQTLEPRFYYVYSEFENQTDVPNFDVSTPNFTYDRLFESHRFSGGDRIGDNNRATLSLTSRWADAKTGLERFRLSVAHLRHFNLPRLGLEDNDEFINNGLNSLRGTNGDDQFWATQLSLQAVQGLNISWTGLWDNDATQTQESLSQLSYQNDEGYLFSANHRFRNDGLEQSDISAGLPLSASTDLIGRWRYDLDANRTIGSLIGLQYESCCWRVQILAQNYLNDDSEIDNNILLNIELLGLSSDGDRSTFHDKLL